MDSNLNPEKKIAPLDAGTELAYERTFMALERTQMAWVRTSLSLITFGFTIAKFWEAMRDKPGVVVPLLGARNIGLLMIVFGILTLVLADFQHVQTLKSLRVKYPKMPFSLSKLISAMLALLGVLALLGALLRS